MIGIHVSRPDARAHLLTARAMYEALGEVPYVNLIDAVLERLEGPA